MLQQYLCFPSTIPQSHTQFTSNPISYPLLTDTPYLNTDPMDNRQKTNERKEQQAAIGNLFSLMIKSTTLL